LSAFNNGLNRYLPKDIRILMIEEVGRPFDARREAVSRTYRYVFSKSIKAVGRHYAWYPRMKFCLKPMKEASQILIGEHDFSSFCKNDENLEYVISHITNVNWEEDDRHIYFEITAIRFFHHMIRIIVGTLLRVGRGELSIEDFKNILDAKDRTLAGPTIPPHGLFLVKVTYNQLDIIDSYKIIDAMEEK
jgi:tRNA pseudouridine38-40 synthase